MKYEELLRIVEDEPVFETGWLMSGRPADSGLPAQLSRWTQAGRLHQLRRGLYALAPPYRKVIPDPFVIANRLAPGSYVSTHSALAFAGVIPEHVAATTSCGPGRPHKRATPLGRYIFQHLRPEMLSLSTPTISGYRQVALARHQRALLATPEKALLDLAYLTVTADDPRWVEEMRLNYEMLDAQCLLALAKASRKPKLLRFARIVADAAQEFSDAA
ncbi:type IV toxin-antitoxin system AbiEi family antitoxin domain-containing protein [Candidatus Foliamicus sp.]